MYFATLLKTTAPVKLPISQLSLRTEPTLLFSTSKEVKRGRKVDKVYKVNTNPTLILRFPLCVYRLTYSLLIKVVLDSCDN